MNRESEIKIWTKAKKEDLVKSDSNLINKL